MESKLWQPDGEMTVAHLKERSTMGGTRQRVAGRRRFRRRRFLAILFFLSFIVWGLWQFVHSSIFYVKEIEVKGYERLSPEAILAVAGLREYIWIGHVRPHDLEEAVRRLPRVANVEVHWGLPNRLSIEVAERRPAALIRYQDTSYLEVDGTGHVLALWEELLPDLILITGLERIPQEVGQPLSGKGARSAAQLAQALNGELQEKVSEIHVGDDGDLTLYTLDGVPVYLGSDGDFQASAMTLAALLDHLENQGNPPLEYIDMRAIDRPVIKEWRLPEGNEPGTEKDTRISNQ